MPIEKNLNGHSWMSTKKKYSSWETKSVNQKPMTELSKNLVKYGKKIPSRRMLLWFDQEMLILNLHVRDKRTVTVYLKKQWSTKLSALLSQESTLPKKRQLNLLTSSSHKRDKCSESSYHTKLYIIKFSSLIWIDLDENQLSHKVHRS